MKTPSFQEDHISQIPALQLLVNMGYTYLSPEDCLAARGGKTTSVLLEDILRTQLKKINKTKISSTKRGEFSDSNIEQAIRMLREVSTVEGYGTTVQKIYDLLTLGVALEQSIAGDKKSFTLHYIDFKNPKNNVYHVSEEFSVMRTASKEHYRPDIVLFVNGIPLCVIECKRPDMKNPIPQAISQHLRNQQEDGIRSLYQYSQLLLSIATNVGRFGTNGTPEKFWAHWEEKFANKAAEKKHQHTLSALKNKPLPAAVQAALFGERYQYVKAAFEELAKGHILVTEQDQYLYGLCRPERLLDFVFNFTVFDNGVKKVARYQQYFAIVKTMKQIQAVQEGRRQGGVIWHTQGSGKSLTMVMLAQAIALDKNIKNPKIILVTDRTDLDTQITKTFQKCGLPVENAATGASLVTLLQSNSDAVITAIINKFETAVKKIKQPLESSNIFVLVDEGHRTQHGTFNINMQKTLPNACFIALTGTPLFKKDKSTMKRFGGKLIDHYTVDKAVRDKAVVPLLYEGRYAQQDVNAAPIDNFFAMISEPLTEYERKDLKKKFSRADQLNIAEQKIYAQCWDISKHFQQNVQGTGFKGQLVAPNKLSAVKYKNFLDEFGIVTSELVISPPDDREGEDSAYGKSSDKVKAFWSRMMDEHGSAKKYQKNIVNRFTNAPHPEIIIVVDKLLTGFDAPCNKVLYLTRNLRGHTLLQAIARVNRVHKDKDYGYIIDYYGVLGALDEALDLYASFDDFEEGDLEGTLTDIKEEIKKLAQKHSELWDVFKEVRNKKDIAAYQQLLKDEAKRVVFYDKLMAYGRILKMALSSIDFHKNTKPKQLATYKDDFAFFMKLRKAVAQLYSDQIDYKKYEGQIQKLIDTHITSARVDVIIDLVNIFDKDAFEAEVEKTIGTRAKADKIASRTAKHISEKMEEDPAFYRKFSEMLKETIRDFEEKRINETQYLNKVKEVMEKVLSRTDSAIPSILEDKAVARAFYGIAIEDIKEKLTEEETRQQIGVEIALAADEIIQKYLVVDWTTKVDVTKKMIFEIGDFLIDEVKNKYEIALSFGEIDHLAEQMVEVAKIRYKQ